MNPSAIDWIPKFLNSIDKRLLVAKFEDNLQYYYTLKRTGFIYGLSMDTIPNELNYSLKFTKEEYTKINLFHALLFVYLHQNKQADFLDAIKSINEFYKRLDKGKTSFFKKLSASKGSTQQLENIIAARLDETQSAQKKTYTSILTYALLYVDVLVYIKWLSDPKTIKSYDKNLESTLITCCFFVLKAKKKKNKYDQLLIELFESSSEYSESTSAESNILESLTQLSTRSTLEKQFILDICIVAVWEDQQMDTSELKFLRQLTADLQLAENTLSESVDDLERFSKIYGASIKLFENSNPVKQFYKDSSATVKRLILRNKNRLLRELEESGELLVLLSQSTLRDLNKEEKSKVKGQLLDICKSIPSLTIFLLPGGTVLLPLLVKFIPKLLPSAFNENRIEDKRED